MTGKEPNRELEMVLSHIIHWLIGMTASGAYGAARMASNVPYIPGGAALGTALWLLGDEMAMPLPGLTKGPTAYPPELHVHSWGTHLAYGLASATTTQLLYRLTA